MILKRTVIFAAAVIILLLGGSAAYSDPGTPVFNDIRGSFAEDQINRLAARGIIGGVSPGEFRPNDSITRQQFAVLIARTLGIQPTFPPSRSFPDMAPGTAETGCVEALAGLGVIKGYGEEGFKPDGPVLRQDAAVIIHKALGKGYERPSVLERYADKSIIPPYAADSVAFVTGRGWMTGSGGSFNPLGKMSRAEAASLASRLLDTRRGQALTAIPVVSPQDLKARVGDQIKINPRTAKVFPPFTTVFGMDSPSVAQVSPEGTLTAKGAGKSTITVNAGYNSYNIKAEVLPEAAGEGPSSPTVAGSVYAGKEWPADCSVKQQAPDTAFQQVERSGHPGPAEGLASKSDTWTGFLRQQGRDITVDLKEARPVSSVSLEFLQDPASGIWLPGYLRGEVSVDGVTWYHLGYAYHGVSQSDPGARNINLSLAFSPVTARYIRVSFPVDIWVFARRLSVTGIPIGTVPAVLALAGNDGSSAGNYMQVPNINDILLIYTGDGTSSQTLAPGDFFPLVAYEDKKGQVSGKMFDTMLFLPYYGIPSTREKWSAYLDDLFAPGRQLQALDEAVGRMNSFTGRQSREKVILSIPYPDAKQKEFGEVEKGKGQLSFSDVAEDRFTAVQWYYGNLMGKWQGAGFKNLDLAGIYWYGESIEKNSGEMELVQNVARLVRKNKQNFFWIPYFGTKGYESWRSYGFSHVFLQPNYFAKDNPPGDRMDRAAEVARKYSMGIEIECEESVLYNNNYYDLFYKQLDKGHQLGFDGQMTNAYYVGLVKKTLLKAAHSSDPKLRSLYDDVFRWISGTYQQPESSATASSL